MTSTVLAIETSCDETGVAIVRKDSDTFAVLADAVASQIDIHAATGGVVPEVAAREHVQVIGPLIKSVMEQAAVDSSALDAIAVTVGPGLMPALSVGVNAARTLAYAWDKPLVPVHHLEGHIYSALLADTNELDASLLPALALIVSGGHTQLIMVSDHLRYEIVGTTRDDAAGEAFDKVARLLELPYPGGPEISRLAVDGDAGAYDFTAPMMRSGDLDFSFSGLKTEVLYTVRDMDPKTLDQERTSLAASFQQTVIDALVGKTVQGISTFNPKSVLLAGGVAANTELRQQLVTAVEGENVPLKVAPLNLCGDNATMIGQVGVLAFEAGRTMAWRDIDAHARLTIAEFGQEKAPPKAGRWGKRTNDYEAG